MRSPFPTAVPYGAVIIALFVVTIIPFALFRWGLGVLFPFIQDDLGTSRAELGLIASGVAAGAGATALPVGWLVDVIGVRRLQAASIATAAVAVLLFSRIQAPVHGVILGVVVGAALSSTGPAFTKAIVDWVTPRRRGLSLGITQASIPVSGIIAAALLSFLVVSYGWRDVVLVLAIMIALSSIVFFYFYRDKPGSLMARGRERSPRGRVSLVAGNQQIWLAALVSVAFSGVQTTFVSYLVLFLKEHLSMSTVVAGSLLSVGMAGGAMGRVGWGLASDVLMKGRRAVTLSLVGALSLVCMALMARLPSDASLYAVVALTFAAGSTAIGWSGVFSILIAKLAGPGLTGTASGFSSMISYAGPLAIPPLFGFMVDRTGSYDMSWLMMAGVAGLGTLGLGFLWPQSGLRDRGSLSDSRGGPTSLT